MDMPKYIRDDRIKLRIGLINIGSTKSSPLNTRALYAVRDCSNGLNIKNKGVRAKFWLMKITINSNKKICEAINLVLLIHDIKTPKHMPQIELSNNNKNKLLQRQLIVILNADRAIIVTSI